MRIVVTGGAGFLGTLVTESLLAGGTAREVVSLDLAPSRVQDPRVRSVVGDLTDLAVLEDALPEGTDAVLHLAAVLSGGSAQDFDLSERVNLDGTRALLGRVRALSALREQPLRLVFTSSLAVFGGEVPEVVPATWAARPASTYGAFKAIGELLVAEHTRKGFADGRVCRLPTIAVRPGVPNSAASSFASGIIREPLQGVASTCPVPHSTRLWLAGPRTVVANLVHALTLPPGALGDWPVLDLPGLTVTVGEMLASLERAGGAEARALVTDEPDPAVEEIVGSWPGAFDVERALALGFGQDTSFDDLVAEFVEDHLR